MKNNFPLIEQIVDEYQRFELLNALRYNFAIWVLHRIAEASQSGKELDIRAIESEAIENGLLKYDVKTDTLNVVAFESD